MPKSSHNKQKISKVKASWFLYCAFTKALVISKGEKVNCVNFLEDACHKVTKYQGYSSIILLQNIVLGKIKKYDDTYIWVLGYWKTKTKIIL